MSAGETAGVRMFPVLQPPPGAPRSVPWDLLAPHETNALKVHDQTLERLASRGGLSVSELVQVVDGGGYFVAARLDEASLPRLLQILRGYEAAPPATPTPGGKL